MKPLTFLTYFSHIFFKQTITKKRSMSQVLLIDNLLYWKGYLGINYIKKKKQLVTKNAFSPVKTCLTLKSWLKISDILSVHKKNVVQFWSIPLKPVPTSEKSIESLGYRDELHSQPLR